MEMPSPVSPTTSQLTPALTTMGNQSIQASPLSPCSSEMSSELIPSPSQSFDSVSISSASGLSKEFKIPDSWTPSIMQCINQENEEERKRSLVPSIRNEIVRILATNMFCHDPQPHKDCCTRVAKMLVKKYKFLKDVGDHVSGYVSFLNR